MGTGVAGSPELSALGCGCGWTKWEKAEAEQNLGFNKIVLVVWAVTPPENHSLAGNAQTKATKNKVLP